MHTDPISDFLTKLRNASNARGEHVSVPASKLKYEIAKLLTKRGFVKSAFVDKKEVKGTMKENLMVELDPARGALEIKRISKPGQKIYVPATKVRRVKNGLGMGVYTTSRGILPDNELRKMKIGGEYICEIF